VEGISFEGLGKMLTKLGHQVAAVELQGFTKSDGPTHKATHFSSCLFSLAHSFNHRSLNKEKLISGRLIQLPKACRFLRMSVVHVHASKVLSLLSFDLLQSMPKPFLDVHDFLSMVATYLQLENQQVI
jgi:hypothetical protein